jgi:replication factor A1
MNVKDLKPGQGKVDIQLLVKSVSDIRSFNKYGKELRVASAAASDESGAEIKVSLWNDDIKKVNTGDTIQITNGYVSEFNGEKQLSAGKFGKIEVVSGSSASSTPAKSSPANAAAKTPAKPSTKTSEKKPAKKQEEKGETVEAEEDEEEFNYEDKEF